MPLQESDISWQMLRRIVHDWIGTATELEEVKPLQGGCINTTLFLLLNDGQRAVLKITPHRVNHAFIHEAYQLNVFRAIGLPAPQVYSCKIGTLDDPFSYILMEFMEGVNLAEARRQCSGDQYEHLQMHLADLVLTLHSQTSTHYQRVTDGAREEFESWPDFFRNVYDSIHRETDKSTLLGAKSRRLIGRVHERLDRLIGHGDCPRLVHWDIWSTNVLARPDAAGRWWISAVLDPNCKYAHAEAEIAYMELFGTITPGFLRAYQSAHRLPPEYQKFRKPIYQLYSLMNHVHLFGREYVKPLERTLEQVALLA